MMKTLPTWFILVTMMLFLGSCGSESKYNEELKQIEQQVEDTPQSVVEELLKLSLHINDAPKSEQMKYTLLKVLTEDKLFILQESDSTMLEVVDYYEGNGTKEEILQAYYLLAAAYRDMHDSPRATEWYMKAIEFGENHVQLKLHPILARSYGQLAMLLLAQGNLSESLELSKKRLLHSKLNDHDALHELGERYLAIGMNDSATIYFDLARKNCLKFEREPKWILELVGSQLGAFIITNETTRIEECRNILRQYPDSIYPFVALSGMAYYYDSREKHDSACYYWEKCRECAPSFFELQAIDNLLAKCYIKEGMTEQALRYANEVTALTDSIYGEVVLQQSSNAYNQYIYTQKERKNIKERQRVWQYMFLGYFILSTVVTWTLVIFYRNKRRLRNTIEVKDALSKQNVDLTTANTTLEVRLHEKTLQEANIDARTLAQALYAQAHGNDSTVTLSKEQLRAIYNAVELKYPEIVERINNTLPGISPFDRSLLYILKLGLNQSEAARLLDRKRSTISHRMAVLKKNYNVAPKEILNLDLEFAYSLHEGEEYVGIFSQQKHLFL